jgi:hypothetical protein
MNLNLITTLELEKELANRAEAARQVIVESNSVASEKLLILTRQAQRLLEKAINIADQHNLTFEFSIPGSSSGYFGDENTYYSPGSGGAGWNRSDATC